MRLTLYTDYALRALLYLGARPETRVSIRDIAHTYNISENHLVKVVHKLGRGGFIMTKRGRNGGLLLARAPKDIRIGDIVRYTEEDMAIVSCNQEKSSCRLAGVCRLQGLMGEALAAFMNVLDQRTLADVMTHPKLIQTLQMLLPATTPGQRVHDHEYEAYDRRPTFA
ncbi:Rrf2 family transcriptional regulator [Gluconacetobacter entanii]|uniref:Rrf2 family transcriptional regulator n=1 Tax=Gluconacetobacter entanii TaxID=108528 RepID=A0A318Q0D4_9PROT|nr:Rrf2 family transcriptional regulator [Gluconacetobacter entanii]MCE2578832.1 Rrf2 family transcriptional regulator [Komagataeibacter sp. FNDCR1]MBY4639926.1 Rrf2 family transcriptional regulator [Gluconacetobacter entanii]MCW4581633.1 Rrf2 family transcriptional regulator [Gluconacetobacter entanii]MCW4584946.1 Rrf2 family transcriptional regulator [Gluconacetobacter entanii]MCW4588360.1 Rrf2 family transcriptional regulator [Gluconacetobacter entanii]